MNAHIRFGLRIIVGPLFIGKEYDFVVAPAGRGISNIVRLPHRDRNCGPMLTLAEYDAGEVIGHGPYDDCVAICSHIMRTE